MIGQSISDMKPNSHLFFNPFHYYRLDLPFLSSDVPALFQGNEFAAFSNWKMEILLFLPHKQKNCVQENTFPVHSSFVYQNKKTDSR